MSTVTISWHCLTNFKSFKTDRQLLCAPLIFFSESQLTLSTNPFYFRYLISLSATKYGAEIIINIIIYTLVINLEMISTLPHLAITILVK